MGCVKGYAALGTSCMLCENGSSLGSVIGLISGILVLTFGLLVLYYLHSVSIEEDGSDETGDSEGTENLKKKRRKSLVVRMLVSSSQTKTKKIVPRASSKSYDQNASDPADRNSISAEDDSRDEEQEDTHESRSIFGQLKILITFIQILSSMPLVMVGVQFPAAFKTLSRYLQTLNFDLMQTFVSVGCRFALSFHTQFWVHVCLPPVVMAVVFGAYKTVNLIWPAKPEHLRHRSGEMFKVVVLVILLMYPGLANRLFNMLNCMDVEGIPDKEFLIYDMNVECWVGQHMTDAVMAIMFLVIYIFGLPAGMFYGMFLHRKAMWDPSHSNHDHVLHMYGGLYEQVRLRRVFWFVLA